VNTRRKDFTQPPEHQSPLRCSEWRDLPNSANLSVGRTQAERCRAVFPGTHVLFLYSYGTAPTPIYLVNPSRTLHSTALAMASTSEHEQTTATGLCDNCVTGHVFSGTPTGTEKKIGPFDTVYVAQPAEVKHPAAAIVFFTDVFGLKVGTSLRKVMQTRMLIARSWSTINSSRTGSRNGQE